MLKIGQRVRILRSGEKGTVTKVGLIEYAIELDSETTITVPWWNVQPIEGETTVSEERLEFERQDANEVDASHPMAGPKDKIYRKYDRPTREMMKAWFAQNVPLWDFDLWWATRKEKAQE